VDAAARLSKNARPRTPATRRAWHETWSVALEEESIMRVRDIMTPDPACCTAETPVCDVATMMVDHDCGEIPVCDENRRPIGVVTDRDIVTRIVAEGDDPRGRTAGDCMSEPVVTATPDMSVEDCATLMEEHQVRRNAVLNERGV
jgi:CBS domain-containing protein